MNGFSASPNCTFPISWSSKNLSTTMKQQWPHKASSNPSIFDQTELEYSFMCLFWFMEIFNTYYCQDQINSSLFINIQQNIPMGCVSGSADDDSNEISVQLARLKLQVVTKIQKLRALALKQESSLVAEFKKSKPLRAYSAENGIANSVVIKINKIHTYEVIKGHLQKVINYKNHLSSTENAKISLHPSFGIIFYCQSIVNDVSLNNFCNRIKRKFPDVTEAKDQNIDSDIIRHHKKTQIPTPTMVNQYLLKLVNQEGLDLAEVNKVGHNIRYGA